MKIGIVKISTSPLSYLSDNHSSFGKFNELSINSNKKIADIANKISKQKFDSVFISTECQYENSNRSDLKGIELIFWLRLKYNYTGPIITYGFLSSAQILRLKPQYVVIHAPGNLYWRLGAELNVREIPKSINIEDFNTETYKEYLKSFFDINEFRHEEANWWAVKTMWDIDDIRKHKIAKNEYPEFVKKKLKSLNNFITTKIAGSDIVRIEDYVTQLTHLYTKKTKAIQNSKRQLRKARKEAEVEKSNEIGNLRNSVNENYEIIELCKQAIQEHIQHKKNLKLHGALNEGDPNLNLFDERIASEKKDMVSAEEENKTLLEQIVNLETQTIVIDNEFVEEQLDKYGKQEYNEDLETLHDINTGTKTQILLIDDMAHQGWLELYHKTFDQISFHTINFGLLHGNYEEKIEDLKTEIKKTLINPKNIIKSVILDIRLFPEDNLSDKYKEHSGFRILSFLKDNFPGIPVLVTSASNKIWSLQRSFELGAHNYWMKEGFDNNFTKEDSIGNYIDLVNAINSLTNRQYELLNKLNNLYFSINEEKHKFWWSNYTWKATYAKPKGQTEIIKCSLISGYNECKVQKNQVLSIIKQGIDQLNQYVISKNYLNLQENANTITTYRNITIRLAKIIELIHPQHTFDMDGLSIRLETMDVLVSKGDFKGKILRSIRNNATHNNFSKKKFESFIDEFIKYLTKTIPDIDFKHNKLKKELGNRFAEQEKQKQKVTENKEMKTETASEPITDTQKETVKKTKEQETPKQKSLDVPIENRELFKETIPKLKISKTEHEKVITPVKEVQTDVEQEIEPKQPNFFNRIISWVKKLFS